MINESALNRDIQEKLKPVKVVTSIGINGDVLRVVRGNEPDEAQKASALDTTDSDEEPPTTTNQAQADSRLSRNSLHSQG